MTSAVTLATASTPRACTSPTSLQAPGTESLLVRMGGDSVAASRLLKAAVNRVASNAADQISSMDELLAFQMFPFRVLDFLVPGQARILLAASGIYAVMAYMANQRSREFGIRMALGATATGVIRTVPSQSLRIALWGVAVGVSLALAITPLFAHELAAVNPYDGVAYVTGAQLGVTAAMARRFSLE